MSLVEGGEEYKESKNLRIVAQICALEWVHNNIEKFDGDANNITIFGESFGACSVSILPLIKRKKGLFKHVISSSYQFTCSIEFSLGISKNIFEKTKLNVLMIYLNYLKKKLRN